MKKTIAIALVLVMLAALLAGCSGGKNKYAAAGEYICTSMTTVGLTMDPTMLGMEITLTLNDDGSGTLDLFGETMQAKWEASSNPEGKITLNGSEAKIKLTDSDLTIEDSTGASMTFKRPS